MATEDLFSHAARKEGFGQPLAERMRPQTLAELVGQSELIGQGAWLQKVAEDKELPSLLLWGPPGCGKTTLAHLLAEMTSARYVVLSAVDTGIKELKEVLAEAEIRRTHHRQRTALFVDEIHRWNKAQQDALLPHVEQGRITLLGATTENPSFSVIAPLLSRCRVVVLHALDQAALTDILRRAVSDAKKGLASMGLAVEADDAVLEVIAEASQGDARRALGTLELAARLAGKAKRITAEVVQKALGAPTIRYDKKGDEHYDVISAFIKSMRGSDPDAAIYYLARLLEAGEDLRFVARRMVIFASEDIGNADPRALEVAVAAREAAHLVGMPEAVLPLSQAVTYLAIAPKSNAALTTYAKAKEDVVRHGALPVPPHLRNAPTKLSRELGHGKGYEYPHDAADHFVAATYLPTKLAGRRYYEPSAQGFEARMADRLAELRKRADNPSRRAESPTHHRRDERNKDDNRFDKADKADTPD